MLAKFLRLFYTLQHITFLQLEYQIWYRIKNRFISIHWYKKYLKKTIISPLVLSVDVVLQNTSKEYLSNNCFSFLNMKYSFEKEINWNFNEYGKLWNYNLQYFSYLLDEEIPVDERLQLLRDFSINLLENKVVLEPYPVSLRIVNIFQFHNRHPLKDEVIIRSVLMQINYLENNLEFHILANHLLENALAIFISAIYINDIRLLKKSAKLLEKQLQVQILNDGGHYECSPMYQSILLSRLLLAIDISINSKIFSTEVVLMLKENVSKMLSWISSFSFPDNSWALMNDAATGIAPVNSQLFSAAKHLNIGVINGGLKESGFRKLNGTNWEMIVKIGEVLPSYQPGHVHADILSFCLWVEGKQVIVDSGTSTYTISKQRIKERSTSAHNTVSISGINQSDVWSGFRVGKRAEVVLLQDKPDILEAIVYFQGNKYANHKRTFKVFDNKLEIFDEVDFKQSDKHNLIFGTLNLSNDVYVTTEGPNLRLNDNVLIQSDSLLSTTFSEYAISFNELIKSKKITYPVVKRQILTFNFL
jgi:hypothetical protein